MNLKFTSQMNDFMAKHLANFANDILEADAGKQNWRQVGSNQNDDVLLNSLKSNKSILNTAFKATLGPSEKFSELNNKEKYSSTQNVYNFLVNLTFALSNLLKIINQANNNTQPDKKQLQKMTNQLLRELQKQNPQQQNIKVQNIKNVQNVQNIQIQNIQQNTIEQAQSTQQANQELAAQNDALTNTITNDTLKVDESAEANDALTNEREAIQKGDYSTIDAELAADPALIDQASKTIEDPRAELDKAEEVKDKLERGEDAVKDASQDFQDGKDLENDFTKGKEGEDLINDFSKDTPSESNQFTDSPEPSMNSSFIDDTSEEDSLLQENALDSFANNPSNAAPSMEDFTASIGGGADMGAAAAAAPEGAEAAAVLAM